MKKTAVLLAGLLLVTGTVFAEGWDVSKANVEGTFNVIDTQKGMNMSAGDVDLRFKATKEVKEGMTSFVEAKFDEDKENDIDFGLTVTEGDFTAAIGAQVTIDGQAAAGKSLTLQTNNSDQTYLAWNVMGSESTVLTMYPYAIADMSWDNETWETFIPATDVPGFKLAMDLAEGTKAAAKVGVYDNDQAKNVYVLKGEFSTSVSGVSLDAYVGLKTEDDSTTAKDQVTAMGVLAKMSLSDALKVEGEFNTEKTGDADAAVGMYAKVSSTLAEMNGYVPTAYAKAKMFNKYQDTAKGAYTELEGGVKMVQGSFTVTPKVKFTTAENKVFNLEDDNSKEKTASSIGITFGYEM